MLLILVAGSSASYVLGIFALFELHTRYPSLRPFMLTDRVGSESFEWLAAATTPIGIIAIMGTALLIDVAVLVPWI